MGAISTHLNLTQPIIGQLNAAGATLLFSSFFGRWRQRQGAMAVDANAAGDSFMMGSPTTTAPIRRIRPTSRSPTRSRASTAAAASDACVSRIGNGADLLLTKTASPEPVTTRRHGDLHADDRQPVGRSGRQRDAGDPLPAGVTFVSCGATAGGVCGGTGNDRTVTFASIAGLGVGDGDHHRDGDRRAWGRRWSTPPWSASATYDPETANNTATATSHTPGVNPSDTDNDALPNDWETRYGLDPNSRTGVNGAGGDPDADGRTNFQELQEGSTRAAS